MMRFKDLRCLLTVLGLLLCLAFSFPQVSTDGYRVNIPEFPKSPKIDGKLENPL